MKLSLTPATQKLIEQQPRSGKYSTAEDVVAAGLSQLDQQEQLSEFDPGELDRLLAQGEQSGPPLDGEKVLSELRNRKQSKAG